MRPFPLLYIILYSPSWEKRALVTLLPISSACHYSTGIYCSKALLYKRREPRDPVIQIISLRLPVLRREVNHKPAPHYLLPKLCSNNHNRFNGRLIGVGGSPQVSPFHSLIRACVDESRTQGPSQHHSHSQYNIYYRSYSLTLKSMSKTTWYEKLDF
jgi:hypothetical protein